MNYESLIALVKQSGRVKLNDLINVISSLLYNASTEEDAVEYLMKKDNLMTLIYEQHIFEGGSDEFHNLSVILAQEGEYYHACKILDKGLEKYANSIDLLADYLNYGMKCGEEERCKEIYKKLVMMRRRWSWRAYQFVIDYLKICLDRDASEDIDQIKEIADEFIQVIPDKEEGYLAKAQLLKEMRQENGEETFLAVLEYVTSDLSPVQRTPKCDLTLADYYYEIGKNLKAAKAMIERCKRNSVETQLSVNRNYVYLLSALCKISLFYDSIKEGETKKVEEGSQKEKEILDIYNDYHIAVGTNDARILKHREIIEAFVKETGVPYQYDDGVVNDL